MSAIEKKTIYIFRSTEVAYDVGCCNGLMLSWGHCYDQDCQIGIFNAKFQKFGLFESGLAWENAVWHVRHTLACLWTFLVVLAEKNVVWHFWKTCLRWG